MNTPGLFAALYLCMQVLAIPALRAQDPAPSSWAASRVDTIAADVRYAFADAAALLENTGSLRWEQAAIAGGILAGTGLLLTQDEAIRRFALESRSARTADLMEIGHAYGNNLSGLGISGLLYTGGLLAGEPYIRSTGRIMAEALLLAGALTTAIKHSAGRARPYMDEGSLHFTGFAGPNDFLSFPSGHSTVAFAVSTVLAERIDRWWARARLYSLAGLTGWSRIHMDAHWSSDVFLGAAIGTVSGFAMLAVQNARENPRSGKAQSYLLPSARGVTLLILF